MNDSSPNAKFRRFMTFQIILHWIVAAPYMFLLATGALLMLNRLGLASWVPAHLMSILHESMGIAMAILIVETMLAALVGGYWRAVGRDFLHWIALLPRDLAWLAKVPPNTFFPRTFPLPPAGRFNAGQKLHGLFILVAVSGFIVTGLMMILRPAWLQPWVIHAWLFFGAVGFLSLHLFLGLINPVTRRALGGIFTGHVPMAYVREHHALEIERDATADSTHPAAVSWKAMALVTVVVACAVALWWSKDGRESLQHSPTIGRSHRMIMPGMLIAAHADAAKAQRCEACHVAMGPPTDSACLACHAEIARVMRERIGFHGKLTGACATCHADHKGRDADLRSLDSRNFNHELARFSLQGAHQSLKCEQCHVEHAKTPGEKQFVGLETSSGCTQCHADPHQGQFLQNCTTCHSENGWTGKQLLFVHNRDSAFHLNGQHEGTACVECHKPAEPGLALAHAKFKGLATNCQGCHRDPHSGQFHEDCTTCHTERGWTGRQLIFTHEQDNKFHLNDKHATVECRQCHTPSRANATLAHAKFANLSTDCRQCHTDPHNGQFQQNCTSCHTEQGWTGRQLLFAHRLDSKFQLRGMHAELECRQCHTPPNATASLAHAPFMTLSVECRQCHADPHQGQFSQNCTSCHSEQGWKGRNLLFDHNRDAPFKIDAIHSTVACSSCHQIENGHRIFKGLPTACDQCHTTVTRVMAGHFSSEIGKPDPHGRRVECVACHAPAMKSPSQAQYADACEKCHTPVYRELFFDWQRSLDERETATKRTIQFVRQTNPAAADALSRQVAELRRNGIHNVQATLKDFDAILAAHASSSVVSNPSTRPTSP